MAGKLLDPEDWARLERIFEAARELEGDVRRQYLDEACAGDARLRQRVAILLREDDSGEGTLANEIRGAVESALGAGSQPGPTESVGPSAEAGLRGTIVGSYRLEEVIGRAR